MIDLDLFENILNSDEGYVEEGDIITEEFIKRMEKYPVTKVMRLFKKSTATKGNNIYNLKIEFNLHYFCHKCNKERVEVVTKTYISKILKGEKDFICEECKEKERIALEEKRKRESEETKELEIETRSQRTNDYINNFLNTDKSWAKGVKNWDKIFDLKTIDWCYKDVIVDYIKSMPYNEFLQTCYWKAIAEKVRISSQFKCKICNSSKHLSVHHRTYEHHGLELDYMEDLVCICQECHSKFHDIEED